MYLRQIRREKLLVLSLLFVALATTAFAGTNEGFTISLAPQKIDNVEVGGNISFNFALENISLIKGALIKVKYDPALLSPVQGGFQVGEVLTGAFGGDFFGTVITTGVDGQNIVEAGLTLFGDPNAISGGTLGRMSFEVISEIPLDGTFLSVIEVQINGTSADDTDILFFDEGVFGVQVTRRFANKLFDRNIIRNHTGATFTWLSNLPGIDDKVLVWPVGNPEEVQETRNPLLNQFENPSRILTILGVLARAGITFDSDRAVIVAALQEAGINIPSAADIADLASFNQDLTTLASADLTPRSHLVVVTGLEVDMEYAFEASSISFAGDLSAPLTGTFRTRSAPNTAPVQITELARTPIVAPALDQIIVVIRWFTNRPADTRIQLQGLGAPADPIIADENGTLAHIAIIEGLSPTEDYTFIAGSRLVGADELISGGFMTEAQTLGVRTGTFRTPRLRQLALRFTERPFVNISTESAVLDVSLNIPAIAWVDIGAVNDPSAKITAEDDATTVDQLYTDKVSSDQPLDTHSLTLSDLDPGTRYRYRITAVPLSIADALDASASAKLAAVLQSLEADTLTTDPTGNQPWSRDLQFVTSAAGDTLPPTIVEGPILSSLRDRVAVICVGTDVPTIARIFYGTQGGTYDTVDEFEIVDLNAQGKPRFELTHYLTLVGLDPGSSYSFRLEVEAANGKTTVFEPSNAAPAGKIARILQPPGGSGSFVTNSFADTQFPVITFGPVNTSNTHDTAVVEWDTDESADSEGSFGTGSDNLDDFNSSGDNVINHKLVFSNLEPGTSYNYIIGSTDPSGNGSTESALAVFTTNPELDLTRPEIDEGPAVTYKNDRSAIISWKLNEVASGELEFGPSEELGFIRAVPNSDDEQEITLTNLTPTTTYYYKVSSTDLSNNGPTESEIFEFTTDAEADISSPEISDIAFTPADSSVIITWSTNELSDSFIEFGTNPDLLEFNVGDANDVLEHEITLTNLIPGTTYFLQVGSVDRAENQADSIVANGFTTLAFADQIAPVNPANLVGTPGSEQAILTWEANTEPDLAGYNIYRRLAEEEEFIPLASRVIDATYTDLGLVNGATYEYQITALDRASTPNESDPSAILSLVPVGSAAPSTPTGLTRQAENFLLPTFIFTSAAPLNIGAALTYTIQVSTEPDFSNVTAVTSGLEQGAGDIGVGQTAWTIDRELEEGATYYWRVRAVEGDLLGSFSETQEFIAEEIVLLPGDFNDDGTVNFTDFFQFVDNFNQPVTDENRKFDLNKDGINVDFGDFFVFVDNFNRTLAGKRWVSPVKIDRDAVIGLETLGGTRADDQLVTVRVWAGEVEELKAFGLVLNYDPQTVQFLNATKGPGNLLESQGGKAPLFSTLSQTPGEIALGNGIVEGEPVAGHGLLAELNFRLIGSANNAYFKLSEAFIARSGSDIRQVQQVRSSQLRPQTYFLGANFPNPFNPSTSIEYALPQSGSVELNIYDVLGRQVRTLVKEVHHPAGFYTLTWDGQDQVGRSVGTGIYFYRLEATSFTQTRKMLLIK